MLQTGPVAQTFFINPEVQSKYKLDGVITVVDAAHIMLRLGEKKADGATNEALQQVDLKIDSFFDLICLFTSVLLVSSRLFTSLYIVSSCELRSCLDCDLGSLEAWIVPVTAVRSRHVVQRKRRFNGLLASTPPCFHRHCHYCLHCHHRRRQCFTVANSATPSIAAHQRGMLPRP